jgi:hypothetical protein
MGPHPQTAAAPAPPPCGGGGPAEDYTIATARRLIAQAERGDLDRATPGQMATWIGYATAVMKELTRDD